MAKQGQKLDDELKERIRAALVLTDNKNEIAKQLKVSWSTVDKYAKAIQDEPEQREEFERLRDAKKEEVIDRVWNGFIMGVDLGNKMIQEALEGKRDIPLNHISTYNGTMYDKLALMRGESTANTAVTVRMEGEAEEWAR